MDGSQSLATERSQKMRTTVGKERAHEQTSNTRRMPAAGTRVMHPLSDSGLWKGRDETPERIKRSRDKTLPCVSSTRPIRHAGASPLIAGQVYDLIPKRLAFSVHSSAKMTRDKIKEDLNAFYFSSEYHERYLPFCTDFGPVNLREVHRFCDFMRQYWYHPCIGRDRKLIYYMVRALDALNACPSTQLPKTSPIAGMKKCFPARPGRGALTDIS